MEETTFAYSYFSYVIDTATRPKLHQNRRSAGHVPFPLDADFRIYSPLGCTKNAAQKMEPREQDSIFDLGKLPIGSAAV